MADLVQSVDRALTILDRIGEDGSATLSELAAELGVSRPTVFRILATLQRKHYVTHVVDEHRYRLGPAFSRLGRRWLDATLAVEAQPVMADLSSRTGETVNLAVLRNTVLSYESAVEASRTLRVTRLEGSVAPFHSTALGKAVLSRIEPSRWHEYLGPEPYVPATSNTVVTRARLERDIATALELGYAVESEESVPGVSCIAAVLLGPDGEPLGALSVEAPTARATPQVVAANGAWVAAAAEKLSRILSGAEHGD